MWKEDAKTKDKQNQMTSHLKQCGNCAYYQEFTYGWETERECTNAASPQYGDSTSYVDHCIFWKDNR